MVINRNLVVTLVRDLFASFERDHGEIIEIVIYKHAACMNSPPIHYNDSQSCVVNRVLDYDLSDQSLNPLLLWKFAR